jgi:hypothetical protein
MPVGALMTPTEFVMQRLMSELRTEATRVLNVAMNLDIGASVQLRDLIRDGDRLSRMVTCAATLCPALLSVMLALMLRWREQQVFDSDRVRARVDAGPTRISVKDATALLDERHGSVVAYIFAHTVLRLFELLLPVGGTLIDHVAVHVESVAFDVLRGGGGSGQALGAPSMTAMPSAG